MKNNTEGAAPMKSNANIDYAYLAELLFPDVTETEADLEERYPPRNLPEGAVVSRLAPSPTGFVHLGNLVQGMTSERLCHQSGGVLFLRIEDTDAKREVKGAVDALIKGLLYYGISFDEGATSDGDIGNYGPYRQRQRKDIYAVLAKKLVSEGKAYPCFATEEELAAIRAEQTKVKANLGYYGPYAKWRDRSIDEIKEKLDAGVPWVLRFRSEGSIQNKFKFDDLIKGTIDVTENDIDHILLKSDGIPTYHFAHVVDDHLMRTTHVVRGDEWLPSLPFHLQLFSALGWKPPKYLHIGPLMKMEGESKRKLSKRKDPELAISYYAREGFTKEAVREYIMTILNSNYEDWRRANPAADYTEFKLSYKKMNPAGSLFDAAKLCDISKNVVATLSARQVYDETLAWADENDPDFARVLRQNEKIALDMLSIGRGVPKPRKDITVWSDVKGYIGFAFDEYFKIEDNYLEETDKTTIIKVLTAFLDTYDYTDPQDTWFSKIKDIAASIGYAPEMKLYKQNPSAYAGNVADVAEMIRIAVTGRKNSPDLYAVMEAIGEESVRRRINSMIESLS